MISLDGCKIDINQYIFIAMKDESVDVKTFLENKCKSMNINNYHVIVLDYLTDGQATTINIVITDCNINEQMLKKAIS